MSGRHPRHQFDLESLKVAPELEGSVKDLGVFRLVSRYSATATDEHRCIANPQLSALRLGIILSRS
jgi:hypothetical protein